MVAGDDGELSAPRPQPAGMSPPCPASPTGIKDKPVGAVAAGQLEATHPELQLSRDLTRRLPPIKAAFPSTNMPGLRCPIPSCFLVWGRVFTATCTWSEQTAYVTPMVYAAVGG